MTADLLFRIDPYLKTETAKVTYAGPDGIRLDRTLFYPMAGGQAGDTGVLRWQGGETRVTDTRKWKPENQPEDVLHLLAEDSPLPPEGAMVDMILDWERRYAHMRVHTSLHLLCSLLRDGAVTGGSVAADKGRLDFNLPTESLDKVALTAELNRLITEDHPVTERWITDDELTSKPDLVRTMSVMPPMGTGRVRLVSIDDGVDLQPCGGTHVKRTSEIGLLDVTKIENKGKQNRRVIIVPR